MPKLEQEFKTVAPKLATIFLEEHSFQDQRPIRDWHVMRLANNILTGFWRRGSQIEFAVLPNGRKILIDGYHRSWAVVEADKPAHFSILYTPVANMDEVAKLYALHNQNTLARGETEIAANLKELYSISKTEARLLMRASTCIEVGLRHFTISSDPIIASDPLTIMQNVDSWVKEGRILINFRKTADPRGTALFKNRWVGAVCLVAMRYHKGKGVEFTKRLMNMEAPKGCYTRALHVWAVPTTRAIKRKAMEFLPATCYSFEMFSQDKTTTGSLSVPDTKIGWMKNTPFTLDRVVKTEVQNSRKDQKNRKPAIQAAAHDPKAGIIAY